LGSADHGRLDESGEIVCAGFGARELRYDVDLPGRRVGSGGVMLPNHTPLVIAEQFGTLDALYPGRIDL
jgi:hypothetical protein